MSRYQPFYCEENVWWLLRDRGDGSAIFISNEARAVAVWQQRVAPPDRPVVWDYHAVALAEGLVFDLDSRLGVPVSLEDYLAASFLPLAPQAAHFAPRFRVVPAAELFARFTTDRSHMRDPGGGWQKPPPPWPPPTAPGEAMNLMRFVDPSDPIAGEIFDLDGLRRRFA